MAMQRQQDPFWHPVMGAVDMMTQEVINKRKIAQKEKYLSDMQEDRQTHDVEIEEMRNKRTRTKSKIDYMLKLGQDKNLTPESRQGMMGALSKFMSGDVEFDMPEVQQQQMGLRPEVAEFFKGVPGFDINKQVSPEVQKKLNDIYMNATKEQHRYEVDKKEATTRRIRADKYKGGSAEEDEREIMIDTINEFRKSGKRKIEDIDYPYSSGYGNYLDSQLKTAQTTAEPDTLLPGLMSFGEYAEGEKGKAAEGEKFDTVMDELLNTMKDIKKETGKIKKK